MVITGVVLLAVLGVARYEHVTPDPVRMPLLVAVGVFVVGFVVDLTTMPAPDWELVATRTVNPAGQDAGLNRNVRMLENHLTSRTVEPVVQHRLALLTEARLSELGLRRGDPGVDGRLGPTLCDVLDSPARQLSRETLEECIRRIEELSP
ncbi:MAG TPA: hypothetical protein VHW64_00350 [Nocardioides sp.]|uniref:hypothetical protein n=1 Tax=Nocardioides sp. TaxID=35761 RepID=UPI002E311AB6|nr:hypothetical protein [Nocardioides sp.]HEX3929123.1 hypothetical protein [Nocardioides sp.]